MPLSGSGLFLPHSSIPEHLPPTNQRRENLQTFPKFTRTARPKLEARLGIIPPAPPTPFHSLSPRQDHHSTQPTPHSGICQSFSSSESSSSPRSSQAPAQAPPQSSSNGIFQATFLPLCVPLPPPPVKRSHHHSGPVLKKGKPYLQCHLNTEALSGIRDMAQPSGCRSLSHGSRSLWLRVSTPSLSRMPKQREDRRERKRQH